MLHNGQYWTRNLHKESRGQRGVTEEGAGINTILHKIIKLSEPLGHSIKLFPQYPWHSQFFETWFCWEKETEASVSGLHQRERAAFVWIVKLCLNDNQLGWILEILSNERKGFLFEFESKLTFLILHKNAFAYFNLVEILKFPQSYLNNFGSSLQSCRITLSTVGSAN